jgi:hypothetical protein
MFILLYLSLYDLACAFYDILHRGSRKASEVQYALRQGKIQKENHQRSSIICPTHPYIDLRNSYCIRRVIEYHEPDYAQCITFFSFTSEQSGWLNVVW